MGERGARTDRQMSDAVIRATWVGEHRWDTGRSNGPTAQLDGKAVTAQSPVDGLLSAVAACSGTDVVDILAKRRTPVSGVTIDVEADRRAETPRRVTRLRLVYRVDGAKDNCMLWPTGRRDLLRDGYVPPAKK